MIIWFGQLESILKRESDFWATQPVFTVDDGSTPPPLPINSVLLDSELKFEDFDFQFMLEFCCIKSRAVNFQTVAGSAHPRLNVFRDECIVHQLWMTFTNGIQ